MKIRLDHSNRNQTELKNRISQAFQRFQMEQQFGHSPCILGIIAPQSDRLSPMIDFLPYDDRLITASFAMSIVFGEPLQYDMS